MLRDFWNHNVPIADPRSGLPTQDFLRWLQRNRDVITDVNDGIGSKADASRKISTSVAGGLSGGGDLTADRTIIIQDQAGVTIGTYGSATKAVKLTVNKKGLITAIAEETITGSGGGGGTTTPTSPHGARTRWRINILSDAGPNFGNYPGFADVEFRNATGVFTRNTGWTAAVSSTIFGTATNAFDGDASNHWIAGGSSPQWAEFNNNGVAIECHSIKMTASNSNPDEAPGSFQVQYHDGTNWVTAWSVSGQPNWTAGEVRTFTDPALSTGAQNSATMWRLAIPMDATAGYNFVGFGEIEFLDVNNANLSLLSLGGLSYSSGNYNDGVFDDSKCFDGAAPSGDNGWLSKETGPGAGHWIGYKHPSAIAPVKVRLTPRVTYMAAWPSHFVVQTSNDGVNWKTIVRHTTGTAVAATSQTFIIPGVA